jgi:hypothetical protein
MKMLLLLALLLTLDACQNPSRLQAFLPIEGMSLIGTKLPIAALRHPGRY